MKLKTLKDIKIRANKKSIVNQELLDLIIETHNLILQKEAIKHIKEIDKEIKKSDDEIFIVGLKISRGWIEMFFNIK